MRRPIRVSYRNCSRRCVLSGLLAAFDRRLTRERLGLVDSWEEGLQVIHEHAVSLGPHCAEERLARVGPHEFTIQSCYLNWANIWNNKWNKAFTKNFGKLFIFVAYAESVDGTGNRKAGWTKWAFQFCFFVALLGCLVLTIGWIIWRRIIIFFILLSRFYSRALSIELFEWAPNRFKTGEPKETHWVSGKRGVLFRSGICIWLCAGD